MITKKLHIILFTILLPTCLFSAVAYNDTTTAINKAIVNIKQKGSNVMPMMVPTLDHIIKTYKVDLNIEVQKKQMIASSLGNEAVFLRFFDDNLKAPEANVRAIGGIDKITASALYCDCYGLPETFFSDLNDIAFSNAYGTTHAVLALTIIEQRKCKYDVATYNNVKKTLTPFLVKVVESEKPTSDKGIEAIVMLYLSGNKSLIKNEWIERIIKAQDADGSWYYNDHTTVLALWALLEAQKSSAK